MLHANAYHHRSDAYSSLVALVAILGSGSLAIRPHEVHICSQITDTFTARDYTRERKKVKR
jgi:divalent metal cation (Fe/Co/Zn/Cd) transporter